LKWGPLRVEKRRRRRRKIIIIIIKKRERKPFLKEMYCKELAAAGAVASLVE
jgi:hypothetical protein